MKTILLSFLFICFLSDSKAEMTKEQFNTTIKRVVSLYSQELSSFKKEKQLQLNWASESVSASVTRKNSYILMDFKGGLVRKYNLTTDALAIITCHEIGHLIGGFPKVLPTMKYTSEGQADYFATKECFKKYMAEVDTNLIKTERLSKKQVKLCNRDYACLRGLVAIDNVSKIYVGGKRSINDYEVKKVAITKYNNYPSAQCRIDTLRAGLLCKDKTKCTSKKTRRPDCWYKEDPTIKPFEYNENYQYNEALMIGKASTVKHTSFGCKVYLKQIDYFASSYSSDLIEEDLNDFGISIIGNCPYKESSQISGTTTLYKDNVYLNINKSDL